MSNMYTDIRGFSKLTASRLLKILPLLYGLQDEVFLEQQSDERHKFEWEENQGGFRFQLRENWNPKFKEWTLREDAMVVQNIGLGEHG